MTVAVIRVSEAIDIEYGDRKRLSTTLRFEQRLPEAVEEEASIGQVGQAVVRSGVGQPL
jgi:hypothetical protein